MLRSSAQTPLAILRPSVAPSPPVREGSSTTPCDRPRACRIRRRSARAGWAPRCSTRKGASETTFAVSRVHGPDALYETRGGRVTPIPRDPADAPRHSLDSRSRQKVGTWRTTTDASVSLGKLGCLRSTGRGTSRKEGTRVHQSGCDRCAYVRGPPEVTSRVALPLRHPPPSPRLASRHRTRGA